MTSAVEVTMRDRIARALWLNMSIAKNKVALWDGPGLTDYDKRPYFDAADAVLAEMTEPTEAMLEAAAVIDGMNADPEWRAMIQAARPNP